jgi:hypothetical protein
LLIAYNARDKRYFDIYRVNVATGESALIQLNEGVPGYFTDQQFRAWHRQLCSRRVCVKIVAV